MTSEGQNLISSLSSLDNRASQQCECCSKISARLSALETEVAAIPRLNKQAIVNESILGAQNLIVPAIGTIVANKILPIKQAVGLVEQNLDNFAYFIKGQVFNVSVKTEKALSTAEGAIRTAGSAAGLSNQAMNSAASTASKLASIVGIVSGLLALATSVATLLTLGARIDSLEKYVDSLGEGISRVLGLLPPIKATAENASRKADTAYNHALDAFGLASAASSTANVADVRALNAGTAANVANDTALKAQGTAQNALGKADQAQGTAQDASGKADQAQGTAQNALGKADQAQGTAQDASGKAHQAQGTADRAQGTAEKAQGTAEKAQGTAEKAQGTAEKAQGTADRAQGTAQKAQGTADRAQGTANDGLRNAFGALTLAGLALSLVQAFASRPGIPGPPGPPGPPGRPGINGRNGINGKDAMPYNDTGLKAFIAQQHAATQAKATGLIGGLQAFVAARTAGITDLVTKIAQNTYVEKALGVLTFAATIHNGFMLSSNLGMTLETIIDQILGFILPKGLDGTPINIHATLSKTIQEILTEAVGAKNYAEISKEWAMANRIYQASANVFNSITNMANTVISGLEILGGTMGKVGNALKKWGVVGEKAYEFFNPQPNFHNKFFIFLENANTEANTIQNVVQVPISVVQAKTDLDNNVTQLQDAIAQKDGTKPGIEKPEAKQEKDKFDLGKTISKTLDIAVDDLFNAND
ncbi:MAG: hypothetical protein DSM106950_01375 [Stigonema ocellatum SAG 48.90 = DSM 106950]|nr:hypothetical protein [Stigonema ocellatum SAG 48.90 = DSM 106950]